MSQFNGYSRKGYSMKIFDQIAAATESIANEVFIDAFAAYDAIAAVVNYNRNIVSFEEALDAILGYKMLTKEVNVAVCYKENVGPPAKKIAAAACWMANVYWFRNPAAYAALAIVSIQELAKAHLAASNRAHYRMTKPNPAKHDRNVYFMQARIYGVCSVVLCNITVNNLDPTIGDATYELADEYTASNIDPQAIVSDWAVQIASRKRTLFALAKLLKIGFVVTGSNVFTLLLNG
uniref:Uncharacterized protein n=1 Tax=Trichuris muris TaxID=70415 RepID=A0A5S6QRH9_TRIMR